MASVFKTEIVNTKEINKTFMIVFGILYMISTLYIFLYDIEYQNVYIRYLALGTYASGIYFLFGRSFIKPKIIGHLKISIETVHIQNNGLNKSIALADLENIYLKYLDYGSWKTHSIFGNKNYMTITEKSGDKYNFEILIKNRTSKNELKRILNSPEYHEKFNFIKLDSSKTEF